MIKKLSMILIGVLLMGAVFTGCANIMPAADVPEAMTQTPIEPETQIEERSTVQEFLDNYGDEIREGFGELAELFDEGASIDIIAGNGEELIFIFAYGPNADSEAFAEEFAAVMPLKGSMFEVFAAQLKYEWGIDELTVTVRYEDYDGNILAEESFVAS